MCLDYCTVHELCDIIIARNIKFLYVIFGSQVLNSTILQQVFVVEYVVQNQMCDACHRNAAQDFWKAVVQVRQKVGTVSPSDSIMQSAVLSF